MKCPKCKKIFATLNKTRIYPDGREYEYYNCENCGYSWRVEVIDYDKILEENMYEHNDMYIVLSDLKGGK